MEGERLKLILAGYLARKSRDAKERKMAILGYDIKNIARKGRERR
jgi:hypothetical protein